MFFDIHYQLVSDIRSDTRLFFENDDFYVWHFCTSGCAHSYCHFLFSHARLFSVHETSQTGLLSRFVLVHLLFNWNMNTTQPKDFQTKLKQNTILQVTTIKYTVCSSISSLSLNFCNVEFSTGTRNTSPCSIFICVGTVWRLNQMNHENSKKTSS